MWIPRQFRDIAGAITVELRSIRDSLQEQIRATRDGNETANQTRKEIPAHLADLRIPENEKREAKNHRNKAHKQQVLLTWGTWLAFIVAGIYAGIAYYQKRVMADTLIEIEEQTRPWIGIGDEAVLTSASGNEMHFDIPVQNYGHIPALITSSEFRVGRLAGGENHFWEKKGGEELCGQTQWIKQPGEPDSPRHPVPVYPDQPTPPLHVTAIRRDSLLGGFEYLYGCITYNLNGSHFYATKATFIINYVDPDTHAPEKKVTRTDIDLTVKR